jgi:hypothetical protein
VAVSADTEQVVTAIFPSDAPAGTFTLNSVAVALVTSAGMHLNFTIFSVMPVLKVLPAMMISVPFLALAGEKPVTVIAADVASSQSFLHAAKEILINSIHRLRTFLLSAFAYKIICDAPD